MKTSTTSLCEAPQTPMKKVQSFFARIGKRNIIIACSVLLIRDKLPMKAEAAEDDFPFYENLPDEQDSDKKISLSEFIENEDDDDDSV